MTQPAAPRVLHPSAWAILVLPFGLAVGYLQVAVPNILRLRGVDMVVIGGISLLANQPHNYKFLWAPVLDAGWKRKNWYFVMVALVALALGLASLLTPDNSIRVGPFGMLTVYTVVLTVAQAAAATAYSAVLGIMATVVPEWQKGRASGWQTAGNLAGTAAGGGAVAWLGAHASQTVTAAVLSVGTLLCAIPLLFIHEAPIKKQAAIALVVGLVKDVWATLKSRIGWTGLVISLSPVGTGALLNLFSALALDYSDDPITRERMVVYTTGLASGLASAAGALVGGYVADRMNRRVAYVLFGALTGLSALGMMVSPATSTVFTVGCLSYSFCNGLCYAAFYAFVFDMVGTGQATTTKIALFVSASNAANTYVTWLDAESYELGTRWWSPHVWGGRVGMLAMDALSTFVGIAMLWGMIALVKRLGPEKPQAAAA